MISDDRLKDIEDGREVIRTGEGIDAARELRALRVRRDELLAVVARLSQTAPLDSEVAEALEQRGALLAEVGTLRARVVELDAETEAMASASIRHHAEYKARRNEQFAAYDKLLASKDGGDAIGAYKKAIDEIKDERIALHRAWFGTVGVMTPEILTEQRAAYQKTAAHRDYLVEELSHLQRMVRAFALARDLANATDNQAQQQIAVADKLLTELVDLVPNGEPDGAP